jgi:hypothetical protein
MPIKKGLKKKVVKKITKKGTKGSVSQSVVVNINKGKKTTTQPSGKPTIASSLLSGFSSLASALKQSDSRISDALKSQQSKVSQQTPVSSIIVEEKPISQGRLKIDESVLNKFNSSRPSIPARNDIPDIPPFQQKLVSEYFKSPPEVETPKKKDSKVKRLVTSIENRRMGEEDALATRQRQQNKLDYYNNQMPFASEEDIAYKPLMNMTPEQMLAEGKKQYEAESIKRLKEQVNQARQEETSSSIPKRTYVKSGKYSKKNQTRENIDLEIQEEE